MFCLDAVGVSFPLNGLRAFEAVTRHLTLVGAARELHVTPSAVSHRLRNLETYFGRFEAMLSGEGFVLICPALFRKELETGVAACPFDASLQTYAFCIRVPDARLANSNVLTFVQWLESEVERDLAGSDS